MARSRRGSTHVVRFAGRIAAACGILAVVIFSGVEFAQRIEQNVALERELDRTQADIHTLGTRRAEEVREIHRLARPDGVVPYIYHRLRMVRPGQTLIYLVPAASPTP